MRIFSLKKFAASVQKIFGLALPLVLAFSVAAAGAVGMAPCQGRCCCQAPLQAQGQHALPAHAGLAGGHDGCTTSQPMPLHLQSCRGMDLVVGIPSIHPRHTAVTTPALLAANQGGQRNTRSLGFRSLSLAAKARSAPIYLLKQSLLC
jgi:hypothetical protein